VTLLVGGFVIAATVWSAARSIVVQPRVSRLRIVPPSSAALSFNVINRSVALRPDGSRHLYVGANGTTLFVRPLDQLEATPSFVAPRYAIRSCPLMASGSDSSRVRRR
jgi:hypothetical protein